MKIHERPTPYVGISGVNEAKSPDDASMQYWLMDQFSWAGLDSTNNPYARELALGVKATHKTQYLDVENKYGREWYPVGDEFADALHGDTWGLKTAQIFFDPKQVSDVAYRDKFMARIRRRGRTWLGALQFDLLPWHVDESILEFVETQKHETGYSMILQVHGKSMEQLGPDGVVRALGRYAQGLDYTLFDTSHGKGARMNASALLPYLDAAYVSEALQSVGVGVAGGLCADVVHDDLPLLLERYPDLSVDAEGQLHGTYPDGSHGLDWGRVKQYLQAMDDVLRALPREAV